MGGKAKLAKKDVAAAIRIGSFIRNVVKASLKTNQPVFAGGSNIFFNAIHLFDLVLFNSH